MKNLKLTKRYQTIERKGKEVRARLAGNGRVYVQHTDTRNGALVSGGRINQTVSITTGALDTYLTNCNVFWQDIINDHNTRIVRAGEIIH